MKEFFSRNKIILVDLKNVSSLYLVVSTIFEPSIQSSLEAEREVEREKKFIPMRIKIGKFISTFLY